MGDHKIVIENIEPYDGEYEFSVLTLNAREAHRIKQMSGVRAGEIIDALIAGDAAVYVGLAAVVLARNGKHVDENLLWDGWGGSEDQAGSIRYVVGDEQEADAGPPARTPAASSSSSGGKKRSSGSSSGSVTAT